MPTHEHDCRGQGAHYIYYSLSYSFEIGSPTQPGDGLAGDLQDLVVFLHSAGAAGVFLAMLVFYKHVGIWTQVHTPVRQALLPTEILLQPLGRQ